MQRTLIQAFSKLRSILKQKPRRWTVPVGGDLLMAQEYAGYVVLYAEGNPLIDRLSYADDLFEPEVLNMLYREIELQKAGSVLDVGANIGLISLALLRKFPSLRIEAFEPGPHQNSLLEEMIKRNNLASRMKLHKTALADYSGEADFYIHFYGELLNGGSGDGLVDTGRAGSTQKIRVPVERLDDWWNTSDRPEIPVIKIDTEGAELFVLNGAVEFLKACRPSIILEIWPENLINYPYRASDILRFLEYRDYCLYTPAGEKVAGHVPDDFWKKGEGNFVARPL